MDETFYEPGTVPPWNREADDDPDWRGDGLHPVIKARRLADQAVIDAVDGSTVKDYLIADLVQALENLMGADIYADCVDLDYWFSEPNEVIARVKGESR